LKSSFNPLHFVVLVIEKYNSGRCKKLITVSKCVADEVHINYSVPCNKIVSILNGVDIEKFSVSNKSKYSAVIRQKYGIAPDETVLLFVGHEFVRKGLEVIINALQELKMPKLTLLIVGSDKDELFKNKTEKLGLTSKVIFAGRTNEVEKFYAAADIFVLPAAYEPFGLVVTEAMASGLPVIISGNAGAAEVINNGDNGFLLDPQDMKTGLINCIKKLTGDSVLKRSVSIRARETIEKYSWRNMGENTEKVYNEVINAMNRPSPLSSPSRGEDVRIG
jgi:UDP-glucose:(heptosyl)LPS alpha-1,3-glucosyltransferase